LKEGFSEGGGGMGGFGPNVRIFNVGGVGGDFGGFSFRDPFQMFSEIFGSGSDFPSSSFRYFFYVYGVKNVNSFSKGGNSFSHSSSRSGSGPRKDSPITRDLVISLDELYIGCVKKMKIERTIHSSSGPKTETKILQVDVKAGFKEGTKITFEESGDEKPGLKLCL
jgi:DnaJ-class molecular chaperone